MTKRHDVAELKRRASVPEVLEAFGHRPRRGRRMPCPLHGGDNESAFSFDDERWHCFTGCGGGDVIRLVERLQGTDFLGACTWLGAFLGIFEPTATYAEPFPDVETPARAAMLADVSRRYFEKIDELDRLHEELDLLDLEWRQNASAINALVHARLAALKLEE